MGLDTELNTEKTKHMLMFHHQNVGENHNRNFGSKRLKCVTELKMWGYGSDKSELNQQGNKGILKFGECFPPHSSEYCVI